MSYKMILRPKVEISKVERPNMERQNVVRPRKLNEEQKQLLNEFKLKYLQLYSQQIRPENIIRMKTNKQLQYAFSKKFPVLMYIIKSGIQYKQFLSVFFNCICNRYIEPFYIDVTINDKYYKLPYNKNTAYFNTINVEPWDKDNIVKGYTVSNTDYSEEFRTEQIRFTKQQFIKFLEILYHKYQLMYDKSFNDLIKLLDRSNKNDFSAKHIYNYLVYIGDKMTKTNSLNIIISKYKVKNFLSVLTREQLINILI